MIGPTLPPPTALRILRGLILHSDRGSQFAASEYRAELAAHGMIASDPIAPNLLARQFDVNGVGINRVWMSDLACIPTREGI